MSYVDAGDVNTYYEVRGTGNPVVMLHGGFAIIETWEAQAPPWLSGIGCSSPSGVATAARRTSTDR